METTCNNCGYICFHYNIIGAGACCCGCNSHDLTFRKMAVNDKGHFAGYENKFPYVEGIIQIKSPRG